MTNSSYTISTQFSIQKLPISTQLSILTINVFGLTAKEMLTTLSSDQKLQQQPLNRKKKKKSFQKKRHLQMSRLKFQLG